jgi:hypothetical protein
MKGTGTAMLFQLEPASDKAETIYDLYPRKAARPFALKAIRRAISKFGFDHLLNATINYRETAKKVDPKFIPYPATWFNQERFNDTAAAPESTSLCDRQISKFLNDARAFHDSFH